MTHLPPRTYSEWSACLDSLEAGLNDHATLEAMKQGTLEWTSGVAEMFSERISKTLSIRLQRCADQLSRQLSSGADEVTLVRALTNTRSTLGNLCILTTLPAFPEILTTHLSKELHLYAERAQMSLEDSARSDRTGRVASLIRNNSLKNYNKGRVESVVAPPISPVQPVPPATARRRNIL